MVEVFVGFGSNIRPRHHLRTAVSQLTRRFGPLRCSQVFRSPAYGFSGPDFLNLVAAFQSESSPREIDAVLSEVEDTAGRGRGGARTGSRTIDLDLLLYGARVDPGERLPRADVLLYPFVLAPLAELAPDMPHPVTGITFAGAWGDLTATRPALRAYGVLDALPADAAAAVDGDNLPRDVRRVAHEK